MTVPTYPEARQTALESLDRGDAREAFSKFRWAMEYPGQVGDDPGRWRDALLDNPSQKFDRSFPVDGEGNCR